MPGQVNMPELQSIKHDSHNEIQDKPQIASQVSAKDLLDPTKDASKLAPDSATHHLPSLELCDMSVKPASRKQELDRASEREISESINHNRIDKPQLASL